MRIRREMRARSAVAIATAAAVGFLWACAAQPALSSIPVSSPQPKSTALAGLSGGIPPAEALPALTEGPYFKAGSPERTSLLEPGTPGETLTLSGFVFDTQCIPQAGTELEFWQADGNGEYDNTGFRLRGHQFADARGTYTLKTVVPGLYPGRTDHIHVKLSRPGGLALTTQLFFPDVAGNQTDRIFDPRLVIKVERAGDTWIGTFNFILAAP
jgi:protocatechuate 3,4-dioxygenase beta subunit